MWPCCNISSVSTGPLLSCRACMQQSTLLVLLLALYGCRWEGWERMKGSAIILKWRIEWRRQQHLSEQQHRRTHQRSLPPLTWAIPTPGPGNTKVSSEKLCRSSFFGCIIFILSCFKTCFIYDSFPLSCLLPCFFILFLFSLLSFSLHSFPCFDLLLFSHSSQPFLPGTVPFSSFLCLSVVISLTPNQVVVPHHSLAATSHPVLQTSCH